MRLFLGMLGAIALSFPANATTCAPFANMRQHVLSNFAQAQMEKREGLSSNMVGGFPGASRCQADKASQNNPVAKMACYWATDVEPGFAMLLRDLKSCYPGWQEEELTEPSAIRQVRLKQDGLKAGVWIVTIYQAKTRRILMLAFMQKIKP